MSTKTSSTPSTGGAQTLPLSKRPVDWVILFFFAFAFVAAVLIDIINGAGPASSVSKLASSPPSPAEAHHSHVRHLAVQTGLTPDWLQGAPWPPAWVVPGFEFWARFDPLVVENPMWFKVLAAFSPFLFAPYYVYAFIAFVRGDHRVRNATLIYCGSMFTSLSTILAEALWGANPSQEPLVFLAAYGPYWIFPIFLAWRVWPEHPFAAPVAPSSSKKSQ